MAFLYFLSAGSINHPQAWFYFILYFIVSTLTNGVLYLKKPELLFHRATTKADAKGWDKLLTPVAIVSGFHLQSVVMGLDARFSWSLIPPGFVIPGTILYLLAFFIATWAMFVNSHFEANVRIQEDRDHQVISTGPYKIVRHPAYVAIIISLFSIPLIIGSVYGFINAVIATILIVIRTGMEDRTLIKELKGYPEYSNKTKFRILPGLW